MFYSINPFTEKQFAETAPLSDSMLEQKLCLASQVFASDWGSLSLSKRSAHVQNLKTLLEQKKRDLAVLITREMGKPLQQAVAEVEKCAQLCGYAVERAPEVLADQTRLPLAPGNAYITFQPLGVILGIMPWNFPFWQVFRFAIPALLSGNVVLVKHAPNVMLCSAELEKLCTSAGLPVGVYQDIPISIKQVEKVIADRRVRGVSLTGSVQAGRAVASLAGRHLKKSLLELGGSDPYVVLDSADLQLSARQCVLSRMNNSGQSCIAAKRFIVTQKNAKRFICLVIEEMGKYKSGDPMLSDTKLGPLARKDLRESLHSQVADLIKRGARVELGARSTASEKGYFYPPTVLSAPSNSDGASFEGELFGPVALIIIVRDEEEALRTANDSPYGLGSAVFSQDRKKAEEWARNRLQAGSCVVNQALHSHPALPFGGIKDSGYGRELSARGFYEFVNLKTVSVEQEG